MFEQIISIIAPHQCIRCASEGSLLCPACLPLLPKNTGNCTLCAAKTYTKVSVWCDRCIKDSPLCGLLSVARYEDEAKELVRLIKFGRAKSAASPIAEAMLPLIQDLSATSLWIVPLPTATVRVRSRGYDQAALIARRLAKADGATYTPLLRRMGKQRQVGASKVNRQEQLRGAFWSVMEVLPAHPTYVIIDDVITTGSSMRQAAVVLKAKGAINIIGVSFASA